MEWLALRPVPTASRREGVRPWVVVVEKVAPGTFPEAPFIFNGVGARITVAAVAC